MVLLLTNGISWSTSQSASFIKEISAIFLCVTSPEVIIDSFSKVHLINRFLSCITGVRCIAGRLARRCAGLAFVLLLPSAVIAENVTVSIADLGNALVASREEPDAVRQLLLEEIQQKLDELDLQLADNELLLRDEIFNQVVEDGCTNTEILNLTTDVTLTGDTGITIGFESLFEPVELSLRVAANVNSSGRARQVFGFRLGSCRELATDSFDVEATGPIDLQLSLSVALNPEWIDDGILRVTPTIAVTGELRESNIAVDVDDSLLRGLLESFLQDEVDDLFSTDRLQEVLVDLQQNLNESLGGESSDGSIDIELPPSDDEQILALFELLTPQARFPLTAEFLRINRLEIIASLIFDDQERILEILESAAFCELTNSLQVSLPLDDTYQILNGSCVVADISQTGTRFSDAACTDSFDFFPTSFSEFCATALDSNRLGNAQSNDFELERWTLSPGTRFEVGALSLAGKKQPYVQRVNYKNAVGSGGNCALEMRIYKDSPNSDSLKPLIALHGGSWQNRGTGFLGIETMATHFVDQGFAVFAPFYRLVHDSDGTPACHNASFDELLGDVEDAFDWVQLNKAVYGAAGKPVLFGQSAGGHLAAWLAVQKPTEVERAALFYAPTDFSDFGSQIQSGEYTNTTGINSMVRVTGVSVEEFSVFDPLVIANTFPAIVADQPENFPPMFLLHGESDTLLPSRQSVRMCNGLAGDVENGPAPFDVNTSSVSRTFACDDRGSQLHLIAEGEHTLDLCLSDELCFSGSPASAAATADVVERMLVWVAADSLVGVSAGRGKSGGGSFGGLFLLFVAVGFRFGLTRYRYV